MLEPISMLDGTSLDEYLLTGYAAAEAGWVAAVVIVIVIVAPM